MRSLLRKFVPVAPTAVLIAALSCPLLISGCSPAPTYSDAEHHDTHRWDDHEKTLYDQWEHETNRPHVEFERRADPDKKEYWDWRHRH